MFPFPCSLTIDVDRPCILYREIGGNAGVEATANYQFAVVLNGRCQREKAGSREAVLGNGLREGLNDVAPFHLSLHRPADGAGFGARALTGKLDGTLTARDVLKRRDYANFSWLHCKTEGSGRGGNNGHVIS